MPLLKMNRGAQRTVEGQFEAFVADTMRNSAGTVQALNATGSPAFDVIGLPAGAIVLRGTLVVDTAFNTTGTATIAIGDSASASRYLTATNLKTAATTAFLSTIGGYRNSAGLPVRITLALADAAATVGSFRIMVQYIIDGRVEEIARSYPATSL